MKEIFMTFTRFCDNFEFRDHVPSKSPSAIVCRLSSTVYRLCVLVHAVSEKGKLVEIVWSCLKLSCSTEQVRFKFVQLRLRTKLSRFKFDSNTALSAFDREDRSKCNLYQAHLKNYHDSWQNAETPNFKIGDFVFCANMKTNKPDSHFSAAKHVIIETKETLLV